MARFLIFLAYHEDLRRIHEVWKWCSSFTYVNISISGDDVMYNGNSQ